MLVDHPQDLAAFDHLTAIGKGSLLDLDLLAEFSRQNSVYLRSDLRVQLNLPGLSTGVF